MNKIQAKRLLNVARALRDAHAAKKKFTMERFVFGQKDAISYEWDYENDGYVSKCNLEQEFCGTPACALGHYAARTDLQRLLKVVIQKNKSGVPFASLGFYGERFNNEDESCPVYGHPKFEEHFGLNIYEMDELFGGEGCGNARTALQAAKYIEHFVKQKQFPGRSTR